MTTSELLAANIKQTKGMVDSFLADFTEDQMLFRPAKSANHATWQLGHLASSTRGMMGGCDPSLASPLAKDPRFNKEAATIDDPNKFPKKQETMKLFDEAMDAAAAWVGKLDEAELSKPSPEGLRSFAPTIGNVALLLGVHPMMHIGQFTVMRRALGKPVLF
jgi:hypothetical protein